MTVEIKIGRVLNETYIPALCSETDLKLFETYERRISVVIDVVDKKSYQSPLWFESIITSKLREYMNDNKNVGSWTHRIHCVAYGRFVDTLNEDDLMYAAWIPKVDSVREHGSFEIWFFTSDEQAYAHIETFFLQEALRLN